MRAGFSRLVSHTRAPFVAAGGLLLVLLTGCGTQKSTPTGSSTPPDPSATFTRVQREIFTPYCALSGCHAGPSPQLGMSLEAGVSYRSIVGVPSAETSLLKVAPGFPNDSYVVVKVRADPALVGARMPASGGPLSSTQIQLIVDWIRRGAPND